MCAVNRKEFREARARDDGMLAAGQVPLGLSSCTDCKITVQETITGSRYYLDADGKKHHVCSDCYFDAIDEVVTKYPVKSRPVSR
jgi:hypothetical protein